MGDPNFMSGLQTAANALATGYNIFSNERARNDALKVNKKSEEMSNTQISRSLADAHKAGLSTAQWLSMNGMVSNPSLSSLPSQQIGSPDVQSPSLRYREMKRQETLANLQQRSVEADIRKTEAETASIEQETSHKDATFEQEYKKLIYEVDLKVGERFWMDDLKEAELAKLKAETESIAHSTNIDLYNHHFDSYLRLLEYGNPSDNDSRHVIGRYDDGSEISLVVPAHFKGWKQEFNAQEMINLMQANDLQHEQISAMQDSIRNGTVKNVGDLLLKLLEILIK